MQSPVYTTHDQLPDDSLMSKHASVLKQYNVYTACRNKNAAFTPYLNCLPELLVAMRYLSFLTAPTVKLKLLDLQITHYLN